MTVSIIIPIYNVEKYLNECLSSVANQTYKDFEVILIDDGSTDGSGDICANWCNKDNRFVYFYKENGGQGSARNCGVDKANGSWLAFLDPDDWWEPLYLEKMMDKTDTSDAIFCDFYVCVPGKEKMVANVRSIFKHICADTRDRINLGINASVCGAIYRKKIWDEIRIKFPSIIYEDTAIYGVLVCYFSSYDVVEFPLYNYRKRSGSTMDTYKNDYKKMIVALNYLLGLARERKLFDIYKMEYLELCRSQLYRRLKNQKDNRALVKAEMLDFYRQNFPLYVENERITSIGSQISANVYDGVAIFPDVERDVYSFTSIVSIVGEPIDDDIDMIFTGDNMYRRQMIDKDLKKRWMSSENCCEYIILDLLDERNGLISYKNHLFTASEAIDSECYIAGDVKIINRDSLMETSQWEDSCDKFFEIIDKNKTTVILLELYLCEEYGKFRERKKYNMVNDILSINKRLESYYNYIKNKYMVISIALESKYKYTDEGYKFGCHPWYYNDCAIYSLRKKVREIIYNKIFASREFSV